MGNGFFFNLGRRMGGGLRKGRWAWKALGGDEAETIEAEYRVGCDLAREFESATAMDGDARDAELLDGIIARLSERLTNKQRRWRLRATLEDAPGACALPGGFLYVSRSLIELCHRDGDELAGVVGHEMGHVVCGHAMQRLAAGLLSQAAAGAARLPGGALSRWMLRGGMDLFQRAYSRENEREADLFGARLARVAGYDPAGAIRILERIRALQGGENLPLAEYFSTHPPLSERILALQNWIAGAR